MAATLSVAEFKQAGFELYDPETRPSRVTSMLLTLRADKALSYVGVCEEKAASYVEQIATLTTMDALKAKTVEVCELAEPYIAKARSEEGRTELLATGKELAAPYISSYIKDPLEAKVASTKEFAAPYVSKVKESSAPYVAKMSAIRRSERVEAMIAAFNDAREHPTERVSELRAKAVDLIK